MPETRSANAADTLWIRAACLAAVLLVGCASTHEGELDPRLFAQGTVAPASKSTARVALLMSPEVRDTVYLGESLIRSPIPNRHVQVPAGRVVEQALRTAFDDALTFGVQDVQSIPPPGRDFSATVVVEAVQFGYLDRLQYVLPVPLPGLPLVVASEVEVRLAFDLQLLDARGHTVQVRTYDAGREVWIPKPRATEMAEDGIIRLAHEAAWRLAQQAVDDLRAWLDSQSGKP
jgi:hypothetical protein